MPFQFVSLAFRGFVVISSWSVCDCWLVLGEFLVLCNKKTIKKLLAHAKHLPTRQPLHQLRAVFAAEFDGCSGASVASLDSSQCPLPPCGDRVWWSGAVWQEMTFFFLLFLHGFACRPCRKSKSDLQLFCSFDLAPLILFSISFIYIGCF